MPYRAAGRICRPPAPAVLACRYERRARALKKVVVANLKGGAGKTTVATTLAAWWAGQGYSTCLLDLDPQRAATTWLRRRPANRPAIHGLHPPSQTAGVTLSFALRIPQDAERLVVDTPAGLGGTALADVVRGAAAVLIPVLPGEMDSDAAARTVADLLLVGKLDRKSGRLAVIGNRVRRRTIGAERLERFMAALDIPLVATLHDAQAYVHAVREGLGLHELSARRLGGERMAWVPLLEWIESRPMEISAQTALGRVVSEYQPPGGRRVES